MAFNIQHILGNIMQGFLSNDMQLPLLLLTVLLTYSLVLPKTCKDTLMCKIGGVTLKNTAHVC